jgi:hypothetical protein
MKAIALAALAFAQAVDQSPRELLNAARPLTNAEIAIVLAASRNALASKTFRLSYGPSGQGPEILMGPTGLPRLVRTASTVQGGIVYGIPPGSTSAPPSQHWTEQITRITDYTGEPARRCDGSLASGEMVIEYEGRGAIPVWTVSARARDARDIGGLGVAPVFEMLRGAGSLAGGERREIGGRQARAFVSPWVSPYDRDVQPPMLIGDPAPNVPGDRAPDESVQSLWIDAESLLPLRWEVHSRGVAIHTYTFSYQSIDLHRPAGIKAPDCIR